MKEEYSSYGAKIMDNGLAHSFFLLRLLVDFGVEGWELNMKNDRSDSEEKDRDSRDELYPLNR